MTLSRHAEAQLTRCAGFGLQPDYVVKKLHRIAAPGQRTFIDLGGRSAKDGTRLYALVETQVITILPQRPTQLM